MTPHSPSRSGDGRRVLEAMLGTVRQPLLVMDRALRVEMANEGFLDTFRLTAAETVGRPIHEIGHGEWDLPRLRHLLGTVLPRDDVFEGELVEGDFAGIGQLRLALSARRVDATDLILLAIDAQTASRATLARQGFLLDLSDTLHTLSDPDEIGDEACRRLADRLGVDRACWADFDEGTGIARVRHEAKRGDVRSARGFALPVETLRRGDCQVIADTRTSSEVADTHRAALAALGITGCLAAPLIRDGSLEGVLCVTSAAPRDWTEAEAAILRGTADRIGWAMQAARTRAALRLAEERYDLIVGGARDYAIFTIDPEGFITSWPPGAQDVFGWSEDQMIGAPFARTFVPEDRDEGAHLRELELADRDGKAADVRWHMRADGTRVFIEGAVLPLHDAGTTPRGFLKIGQDVTARREAAERLRKSEARLSAIFEGASVGLSEIDLSGRVVRANEELCRILGRSPDELRSMSIADVTHPDDLPETLERVARVIRGEAGDDTGIDKRYVRKDGSIVWANSRATLLPGPAGQPGTLLTVTVDLTARKAAEDAVRESEARFRQFGDASLDSLWIRDVRTLEWEYLSPAFDRTYGVQRAAALGGRGIDFLLDLILPEDREGTLAAIRRLTEGPGSYDYRIRRPSDGEVRWLRSTGFPLLDADGTVRRLGGITHDMTDEKQTADRMDVLLAELQHRTRNLIGVVQAMATRTLRRSVSLEDFAERFGHRLDALARVNGLLSRLDEGQRVAFHELLDTELRGHGVTEEDGPSRQVTLDGPGGIRLPSASVQTLALALHELLTNATKHGALSTPAGRLSIRWRLVGNGSQRLEVDWSETGIAVDPVRLRDHGGYGRELIERALPYQLGAETRYELEPDGLRCVVSLPITRAVKGEN